ncbi:hypothetical protein HDU88_008730, partial [Geranomyces variabilis]
MSLEESGALHLAPELPHQPAIFQSITIYLAFQGRQSNPEKSYIGLAVEPIGDFFKISAKGFQDPGSR